MPAACDRAHHPALGKRHHRHSLCGLQAAAHLGGLRSSRQGLGRLASAQWLALVSGWSPLRGARAGLSVAHLLDGSPLASGLRASITGARTERTGNSALAAAGEILTRSTSPACLGVRPVRGDTQANGDAQGFGAVSPKVLGCWVLCPGIPCNTRTSANGLAFMKTKKPSRYMGLCPILPLRNCSARFQWV